MPDSIVSLTYGNLLRVVQTIDIGIDGAVNNPTVLEVVTGETLAGDNTTVTISKAWKDTRTLASSSETLNLAALTRANLPTVDFTGLKVKFCLILGTSGQVNYLSFLQGSTNPYLLFGSAAGVCEILGDSFVYFGTKNNLAAVSSSAKNILVLGTTGYIYTILLVAG